MITKQYYTCFKTSYEFREQKLKYNQAAQKLKWLLPISTFSNVFLISLPNRRNNSKISYRQKNFT